VARRTELLQGALRVARRHPPRVIKGDLRNDLTQLAEQAASTATLVVFHCSVLAYVEDRHERERFGGPSPVARRKMGLKRGTDVIPPTAASSDAARYAGEALLALELARDRR